MTRDAINRTTYNAVVGRMMARHRENSGLDQAQFAEQLGMSQSSWSRIERGQTGVSMSLLARVAEQLRVPPHLIVEEVENAASGLENMGVEIVPDNGGDTKSDVALALLTGAALGILIAQVLKR